MVAVLRVKREPTRHSHPARFLCQRWGICGGSVVDGSHHPVLGLTGTILRALVRDRDTEERPDPVRFFSTPMFTAYIGWRL